MSFAPEFLEKMFVGRSKVLSWEWVPPRHVLDGSLHEVPDSGKFVVGDDYVVWRLDEMYLKNSRVLWKEFYPVVHSFTAFGDPAAKSTISTIAGPGQLKDLGSSSLDRLIGLSYRLAGPVVYDGQDIDILAGLYAVPAADGAKVLIDTLSQLSGLVPSLKQAVEIANVVKAGTEGLLQLDATRLTIGVRDTLLPPNTGKGRIARPGFLVAANVSSGSLSAETLWIKEGRLYEGVEPETMKPFASCDMMLFELHAGPSRAASWATLPSLSPHAKEFDTILRDTPIEKLMDAVNAEYRRFEADVRALADLTRPDKAAIRALVADDLKERVSEIRGKGPIEETRSLVNEGGPTRGRGFSPLEIADILPGEELPSREDGLPLFS